MINKKIIYILFIFLLIPVSHAGSYEDMESMNKLQVLEDNMCYDMYNRSFNNTDPFAYYGFLQQIIIELRIKNYIELKKYHLENGGLI